MAENNRCEKCSKYGWEDGDTLYEYNSWDGGIDFHRIRIHYCPICGNKLYKDSEKESME